MKNKLITTALSTTLLFSVSYSTELSIEENIKKDAQKAINIVAGSLQTTLMKKVKEGGLPSAANFCSTNATSLAKSASKNLDEGVKLKRITDKPRNVANMANEEQLTVFEEIKAKLAKGENIDMLVKQKSANHFQVYKPIKMKLPCLKCHGIEQVRDKIAYEIISKKYPEDKAVNYKLGDFRGAFLVDIIK